MTEKQIETQILNFLKSLGWFVFKVDRVGTFDPQKKVFRQNKNPHKIRGVSDILGCVQGRMLAIEVKAKDGRLSPYQTEFITRVNKEGGHAMVARSLSQAIRQLILLFPDDEALFRVGRQYLVGEGVSEERPLRKEAPPQEV